MKRIKKINNIGEKKKLLIVSFFPILALLVSCVFGFESFFREYVEIIKHPGLLITDYTYVGGFYGTLLNIFLVSFLNICIIYIFKIPLNGLVLGLGLELGFRL